MPRLSTLLIILILSLACSGKDIVPPNPDPVPSANVYEVYETTLNDGDLTVIETGFVIPTEGQELSFELIKEGHPSLPMGNQRLLFRSPEDFSFWYKFMTTEYHENPNKVLDTHDVVLIINYRTRWAYEFVMEKMMLVDGNLNIYYSHRADHIGEQGIVDYQFYLVGKTYGSYRFIEVE